MASGSSASTQPAGGAAIAPVGGAAIAPIGGAASAARLLTAAEGAVTAADADTLPTFPGSNTSYSEAIDKQVRHKLFAILCR